MSELSKLQGQPKKYKIGEIELELKPLGLDDMKSFAMDENTPIEQQTEASLNLIKKTLKESVQDATDEEINKIGLKYMEELMSAIMDVNGMGKGQDKTSRMKDVIAARQTQAKSQGQ